jgi:hypothetical protein
MQRTGHLVKVERSDHIKLVENDECGDGTVPSQGALPYGWANTSAMKWIDQKHSTMCNGRDAWVQIHGVFTAVPADMALFTGLCLDLPEWLPTGAILEVFVRPTSSASAPLLRVTVTDADTDAIVTQDLLRPTDPNDHRYTTRIDGLSEGIYRIEIDDPAGTGGVTPISDLLTVL